ncbi:MAG: outer membrane lipoprotein chaperone LolA [Gammaproteobacteria bacterium]|nr:outer membrane lipoprotein chaperone LolA [Gammaproteobacteria bacterium]
MRGLTFLFIFLASLPAQADSIADLKAFIAGLTTFQADFVQTVRQGSKEQRESGVLTLKRPTRFRWDYLKPHPHMVLADGFHVWVYDKELEQASRQPQKKAVSGTPAQVLTGDVPVEQTFVITALPGQGDLSWVKLVPRDKDSQYDYIKVALRAKQLARMDIVDKLGQTTEIEFAKIKRNPEIPWDFFIFEPPKGVDLIDDKSEE